MKDEFIDQISNGTKRFEMRLWSGKKYKLKSGDIIEFRSTLDDSKRIQCTVKNVYYHPDFETATHVHGFQNIMPKMDSHWNVVKQYKMFYMRRNLNKYIVVVYEI